MKIVSVLLLFAFSASATEISSVHVENKNGADIRIPMKGQAILPSFTVKDNAIELNFGPIKLEESMQGKLELNSPHALISRATLFSSETSAKGRILVNGSVTGLKERVSVTKESDGVRIHVDYPKGADATLALLKEEEQPVLITKAKDEKTASSPVWQGIFLTVVILLAGAAAYFALRVLKRKGQWGGTRKYLVEQVSYTPIGHTGKTGVALIRAGSEFVLVGVTPQGVNMLTNLKGLEAQYREETQYERSAFKDAVEEEMQRMRKTPEANA